MVEVEMTPWLWVIALIIVALTAVGLLLAFGFFAKETPKTAADIFSQLVDALSRMMT